MEELSSTAGYQRIAAGWCGGRGTAECEATTGAVSFCCSNQAVLSFEEKSLQETLVVNETTVCGGCNDFYVYSILTGETVQFYQYVWKRIQTRGSTINYGISFMPAIPALLTYVAFSHIDKLMFFWAGGSIFFGRCCLVENLKHAEQLNNSKKYIKIQGPRLIEACSIHTWVCLSCSFKQRPEA